MPYRVSSKWGGYTQSRAFKNQKINLALSAVSLDHNYCRIFTKQFKCPSRLGGSECQGFLRLETASKHVLEHHQTFWISSSGHLNIQAVSSTSKIHSLGAQFKQYSNRCNATVLQKCLISRILKSQVPSRKGRTNDNSYSNMANTTLESSSVKDVNAMPTAVVTTAAQRNKHPLQL